ncbi:MAG: DUF2344 domain-containing protein [Lachnospiraceae bacterium]|nr:DUF2344 domain-containing protein [Lachnospiraceae bacterium]
MRVRMKFSKTGSVKYIGHLDIMRYFQKLMRRSGIPIAYSAGMSPHQIMSFALPLGIGDESLGEYADIELTRSVISTEALNILDAQSVPGIKILSFKMLPDGALNAMASVEAADYEIVLQNNRIPDLASKLSSFMEQEQILTIKKTKKSEREIDLKQFVFHYESTDDTILVRLKCGSVDNTKPELFMDTFLAYCGLSCSDSDLLIRRIVLYTVVNDTFVSLDDIGENIG